MFTIVLAVIGPRENVKTKLVHIGIIHKQCKSVEKDKFKRTQICKEYLNLVEI